MKINSNKIKFLLVLSLGTLVETGSNFRKCLNNDTIYNRVASFASNIVDKKAFCCNNYPSNWECIIKHDLEIICPTNYTSLIQGQCNRIGQSIFCVTYVPMLPIYNGGLCGGLLDDIPITNNSGCSYLEEGNEGNKRFKDFFVFPTTLKDFTWMCCHIQTPPGHAPNATTSFSCGVPTNVMINETSGMVDYPLDPVSVGGPPCYIDSFYLMCFVDNGGWSCIVSSQNIYRPWDNSTCTLQVVKIDNSSSIVIPTVTQTITETVVTAQGIPAWGTAIVGVGSSLVTILLGTAIRFG